MFMHHWIPVEIVLGTYVALTPELIITHTDQSFSSTSTRTMQTLDQMLHMLRGSAQTFQSLVCPVGYFRMKPKMCVPVI